MRQFDLPSDDPVLTALAQPRVGNRYVSKPKRVEPEFVTAARKPVIAEIKSLLGNTVRSWAKHENHLNRIPFAELCARRDQLKEESQREFNFQKDTP